MDVTHKCSTATVSKQGVGVNILGGKAAPLSFNLIPAQTETLHLNPKPKVFFFHCPIFLGVMKGLWVDVHIPILENLRP